MEVLVAVVLALAVAAFVSVPLRRSGIGGPSPARPAHVGRERSDMAALEAAKEAKYREIRDLELDRAAGKVDDEEFAAANAELRSEAVAILDRLDAAKSGKP